MQQHRPGFEEKIRSFCRGKRRIFLYGPGHCGVLMQQAMEILSIDAFAGFLSTTGTRGARPSIPIAKVVPQLCTEDGIVFSFVGENEQREIAAQLPCPSLLMLDREWVELHRFLMRRNLVWNLQQEASKTLPENIQGKRILVIQLEATFGDMVWSTAFLREMRKAAGAEAEITMVVSTGMHDFQQGCPYVNRILDYDGDLHHTVDNSMVEKAKRYAETYLQGFDMVFLPRRLPEQFSDAIENVLLANFSGARIRIAHMTYLTPLQKEMYDLWSKYFSVIIRQEAGRAEANCDCDLLRACGIPLKDEDTRMEYWLSSTEREIAARNMMPFAAGKKWKTLVVVGIVSSVPSRGYSPEGYRWLFHQLPDVGFVILGGKDAGAAAREAAEGCNNVLDFTGKTTIPGAAAMVEQCDAYLGSDTGLMHFAAAFGKPCVLVTSSLPDSPAGWGTAPLRTGPWLVPKKILQPKRGLDGCKYLCSAARPHCINTIPKEDIRAALESLLREQKLLSCEGK